eukprot:362822-Chlamydomonas_euryale.AAC.13
MLAVSTASGSWQAIGFWPNSSFQHSCWLFGQPVAFGTGTGFGQPNSLARPSLFGTAVGFWAQPQVFGAAVGTLAACTLACAHTRSLTFVARRCTSSLLKPCVPDRNHLLLVDSFKTMCPVAMHAAMLEVQVLRLHVLARIAGRGMSADMRAHAIPQA